MVLLQRYFILLGVRFLKKIAFEIGKKTNDVFIIPVEEQKSYIQRFNEPVDNIERSYYQYCCQMKLAGTLISYLLNIASLPLLIFYYFKKNNLVNNEKCDAAFISFGVIPTALLPATINEEFPLMKEIDGVKEFFTEADKQFFKNIFFRYPFSWHFLFKNLLKIRTYSYIINSYQPKCIIVCGEYSFTSSVLTDYCNYFNVHHYNVMHGEKFFFMRDSFFSYNKCFIWGEYYCKLFHNLRAAEGQFVVYTPQTLCLGDGRKSVKLKDYTYYLGAQRGIKLKKILSNLQKLSSHNTKVVVRPHPIYTDLDELKNLTAGKKIEIENPNEVNITVSVLQTANVISLYSTVLNQAYHSNVEIVIDDVTEPEE